MDKPTSSPNPVPESPSHPVDLGPLPLDLIPSRVPNAPRRPARKPPARGGLPPYLRRPKRTNKNTILYRAFDSDDVLLYVGITDDLGERTFNHARASTWMEFAATAKYEHFTDRREAEEVEISVIQSERPLFNLAYNDDPQADQRLVDYLIEHDRRDLLRAAVSRA